MADDRKKPGEPDRSRVNLNEDYEIRYWCKELGVTRDILQHLVAEYGSSVDKIRAALTSGECPSF